MSTTLEDAITRLENTNPAYNNPGAISGTGDTGSSFGSGIGVYSTLAAGKAALDNQIQRIYSGASSLYPGGSSMTLDQFGQIYAPNQNEGSKLSSILGVPSSTQLSQIPSGVPTFENGNLVVNGQSYTPEQVTARIEGKNTSPSKTIFGISLEDVAVIIVGVILIAAGVFSFRSTQTVIETGTNIGKRIAEVAA